MIPSAPASRADFVAGSSMEGTRTHGEHPVPAVAATIAWTLSGPIGPCSWSIITTSAPAVARACVATGDHFLRDPAALSGGGVVDGAELLIALPGKIDFPIGIAGLQTVC